MSERLAKASPSSTRPDGPDIAISEIDIARVREAADLVAIVDEHVQLP